MCIYVSCVYVSIYTHVHAPMLREALVMHSLLRVWTILMASDVCSSGKPIRARTVSFHNFNSHNFKLSVSNPRTIAYLHFKVKTSQGLRPFSLD